MASLKNFTELVTPTQVLHVIEEDPDDDRVIECAVASGTQFIITGDKHLLRLGLYESIRILKVAEFLNLVPSPSD